MGTNLLKKINPAVGLGKDLIHQAGNFLPRRVPRSGGKWPAEFLERQSLP